jgi:hypothetical protein
LKQEFPELLPIKESLIKYVFKPNQKTAAAWCHQREVMDELLSIKKFFVIYVFKPNENVTGAWVFYVWIFLVFSLFPYIKNCSCGLIWSFHLRGSSQMTCIFHHLYLYLVFATWWWINWLEVNWFIKL